jgi:hypothetical protein
MKKQLQMFVLLVLVFLTQFNYAQITISTDRDIYNPNESINVSFSNGPGNPADWIGVYKIGEVPGIDESTLWCYVNGTQTPTVGISDSSVRFPTGLDLEDSYWVGFFENDSYTILTTDTFQVLSGQPMVTTDKEVYDLSDSITVTFINGPNNPTDWIGIYHPGDVPGAPGIYSILWFYVNGTQSPTVGITDGSVTFAEGLSEVGMYWVGFFENDGYTMLDSIGFAVSSSDSVAPLPPANVFAFAGDKQNVITWEDVPGEDLEKYDVYYSDIPITDPTNAEVVKLNIAENNQLVTHLLLAPNTDQNTTYYYAVVCRDFAGNQSVVSANSDAITNVAKGVSTLSLNAPAFVADGDLSEWQSITPFRMFPSDGSGYVVTNTTIDGDADLSVLSWVAVDANYLYGAFDITDDIVVPSANTTSWQNDSPDIFLGLYNWHHAPHTELQRGAQPDYHLRFAYNRMLIDNISGADSVVGLGPDYYWQEKFPSGYVVEFKISWADLAAPGSDNVFVPVEGMRIPIDYSINDADATNSREGVLAYSINNEDQSWADVSRWSHTWIGNLWNPVSVENEGKTVTDYSLSQNFPNPFNPCTQIKFALKKSGFVSLKVYDILGKEVATLVKSEFSARSYNVNFDASGLASGIYFYRLESGSFVQTNKMMLLK